MLIEVDKVHVRALCKENCCAQCGMMWMSETAMWMLCTPDEQLVTKIKVKSINVKKYGYYGAVYLCTTNFVQTPIHWQKNLNFILLQGARFYSEKHAGVVYGGECK